MLTLALALALAWPASARVSECQYESIWDVPIPGSVEARVLSPWLVEASPKVVARFAHQDSSRYLSIFDMPTAVWVSWKRGNWPHAAGPTQRYYVARDCDADLLTWRREPCVRVEEGAASPPPLEIPIAPRVAHNLGLAPLSATGLFGLGGETSVQNKTVSKRATSRLDTAETTAIRLEDDGAFAAFPGGVTARSPGCVERRDKYHGLCQFDGRFSLAVLRERRSAVDVGDGDSIGDDDSKGDGDDSSVWLYARANTHTDSNGRFVSAAKLALPGKNDTVATADRLEWGTFHLLTFLGAQAKKTAGPSSSLRRRRRPKEEIKPSSSRLFAEVLSEPRLAVDRADIYTAAVNEYRGLLLGLFSTIVRVKAKRANQSSVHDAAILMAASCDGVNFSTPVPVVRGVPVGDGELNDHVVDGLLGADDSGKPLYFFVHHGVPGSFEVKSAHCPFWQEELNTAHRTPKSHVARYEFNRPALHAHLRAAVADLRHAGRCPTPPPPLII